MEQFREKLNLKYILADMTPGKNKHRKFLLPVRKKCVTQKKTTREKTTMDKNTRKI